VVDAGGSPVTFTQITAGAQHACGLDAKQHALCWGRGDRGELRRAQRPLVVSGFSPYADVAGYTASQQAETWTTLSAGETTTCGIAAGGTFAGQASCWGDPTSVGNTLAHDYLWDGPVAGGFTYQAIAAGSDHSCGVTTSGDAVCWGKNQFGQLGDGTNNPTPEPTVVTGSMTWSSLTVGAGFTCATNTSNAIYCWGNDAQDQLGDNSFSPTFSLGPVRVASSRRFASVSSGVTGSTACALVLGGSAGGPAFCWGAQTNKSLGIDTSETCGTTLCRTTPVPVVRGGTFSAVAAGGLHTCVLDASGKAICFGNNNKGQLGRGTYNGTSNCPTPTACTDGAQVVSYPGTFTQIASGGLHTCGIDRATQNALCWGEGSSGQLGIGTAVGVNAPYPVSGGRQFTRITAGALHTCAIDVNGALFCWGDNSFGQLGIGSSATLFGTPQLVVSSGATSVTAGDRTTCAIINQQLKCWGDDSTGAIGDGAAALTGGPRPVPTLVLGGPSTYLDYLTGSGYSCGIQIPPPPYGPFGPPTSGSLYCWGVPAGSVTVPTPPLVTASGLNFRSLQLGGGKPWLCGITASGATQCFGRNYEGELGAAGTPSTGTSSSAPVVVTGD
jgi:alpha-tubulin suppressor-like RCC1 family protein